MYLIVLLALLPIERSNAEKIKCVENDRTSRINHICGCYLNGHLCDKHREFTAMTYSETKTPKIAILLSMITMIALSIVFI